MHEIIVKSRRRWEFIDITERIEKAVEENAEKENGLVHLWCPHTTAGLCVTVRQDRGDPLTEDIGDPDVVKDVKKGLQRLAPYEAGYSHFEMNSDAHIASILTGLQLLIPYKIIEMKGLPGPNIKLPKLQLGQWQAIFLVELDGQRERKVWVNFI